MLGVVTRLLLESKASRQSAAGGGFCQALSVHCESFLGRQRTTTASANPLEMTSASMAIARCMLRVADSQSCFCMAASSEAMADFRS